MNCIELGSTKGVSRASITDEVKIRNRITESNHLFGVAVNIDGHKRMMHFPHLPLFFIGLDFTNNESFPLFMLLFTSILSLSLPVAASATDFFSLETLSKKLMFLFSLGVSSLLDFFFADDAGSYFL